MQPKHDDREIARRQMLTRMAGVALAPALSRHSLPEGEKRPKGRWKTRTVRLGYIDRNPSLGHWGHKIADASTITPNRELQGEEVDISIVKFYVHSFPGAPWYNRGANHRILISVRSSTDVPNSNTRQDAEFTCYCEATNQQTAGGLTSTKILSGIKIGADLPIAVTWVDLARDRTANLMKGILSTPGLSEGLSLSGIAGKPIVDIVTGFADATIKLITSGQNKDRKLVAVRRNLGFTSTPGTDKLREGLYTLIQGEAHSFEWPEFAYVPDSRAIHYVDRTRSGRESKGEEIQFNYMLLAINKSVPTRKS